MLRRVKRAGMRAKACKVLMTIEIKSLYFPYEILRSLGQDAELSFTFQRGNKVATTYECELSLTANGRVEVMCNEKIALEVTMYKENETKYQKKRGKLIVQVLTDNGWEDLGKTHIDLHLIANDLQPIQISAELENCIVKGAIVDFIISPQLLDQADDDSTIGSMSEISEMTGNDSPSIHRLSGGARGGQRLSLTKRLSQTMGLSSPLTTARHISSPIPVPLPVAPSTSPTSSPKINHQTSTCSSGGDNNITSTETHSSSPDIPSGASVDSHHSSSGRRRRSHTQLQPQTSSHNTTNRERSHSNVSLVASNIFDIRDQIEEGNSLTYPPSPHPQNQSLPSLVTELQQELDLLREAYNFAVVENEQLKNERLAMTTKLKNHEKKHKELQRNAKHFEDQLQRKDTEIKAVLNFQKKLESRMTAFVAKEKALALKEKAFLAHNISNSDGEGRDDGNGHLDLGLNVDLDHSQLQRDVEVLTLQTEVEALHITKKKLEADIKKLQELNHDSNETSAKLSAEIKELKEKEKNRLERENHKNHEDRDSTQTNSLSKNNSFRTTTTTTIQDETENDNPLNLRQVQSQHAQAEEKARGVVVLTKDGIIMMIVGFALAFLTMSYTSRRAEPSS